MLLIKLEAIWTVQIGKAVKPNQLKFTYHCTKVLLSHQGNRTMRANYSVGRIK